MSWGSPIFVKRGKEMSNLADLFRWKTKVELMHRDDIKATVYVRVVGDLDYQEARTVALRKSREQRMKLRDNTTEEYMASFIDLESLKKEDMIDSVVASETPSYSEEGLLHIKEVAIPELSDTPTLEEQEEYTAAQDEAKTSRIKQLTDYMEKRSKERRKELEKDAAKDIKKLYVTAVIDIESSRVFANMFRDFCIYKGTYKDTNYKTLAFDSFEEYLSSNINLKTQLSDAYNKLELMGEDLKN